MKKAPPQLKPPFDWITAFWQLFVFVFSIVLTIWCTLWSVKNTLVSQMSELKTGVDQIKFELANQNTLLRHDQAEKLLEYYIDSIQCELVLASENFFNERLNNLVGSKIYSEAENFVFNETNTRIKTNRSKLSGFLITPDKNVAAFLDDISRPQEDIILKAQDDVMSVFKQAIDGNIEPEEARKQVKSLIVKASHQTREKVLAALKGI